MIIFHVLGPIAVIGQPAYSAISRLRGVRTVLATLLHNANQHVSADRLAECVWSTPPASARANLRTQIAALRRALDDCSDRLGERLTTRRAGPGDRAAYLLAAVPDEIDANVFARLADQGHEQLVRQCPDQAVVTLRAALDLWRGPAGDDLPDTPALRAWSAELTERKLTAEDDLAKARLKLADDAGLVATLRRRLAANPHREPTAELLIRALHATGDRTGALRAYQSFRAQLVDDLGIEPSSELQTIHIELLRDERATNGKRAPGAAQSGQAMTRVRHPGGRRRVSSQVPSAR